MKTELRRRKIMEDKIRQAIEQMKKGDEKGFNAVYSATYNRVYFRAKQLVHTEEDAQDLTQIVFVEAYRNIHTLQTPEALYAWLFAITCNQAKRLNRKRKDILLGEEAEGMLDELENNDLSTMPELTADQKATADIVRGIIEELPELQKVAVVAYYFDGMKVEQIAEMMECSENTIKSRLNYARKYIKARVEEKEKKEGYRLHVLGLPVLWYAIRTMADKTKLTVQAAQNIYNGACSNVGLQGGVIAAGEAAAVGGEAAKATGLGAKAASMGTAAKALMIAGAVAVAGIGTAAVINLAHPQEPEQADVPAGTEEVIQRLTLADDLSEYLGLYFGDYWKEDATAIYPHKVSDTEYRFSVDDLKAQGDSLKCVLIKEKIDHLPEGVELAIAYNDSFAGMEPETLNMQYLNNFTTDTWSLNVSTAEGFIIRLVDTTTAELEDAWKMEDDYSEFIKMYGVEVPEPYEFAYQYDGPTLTATKVSDDEYRFDSAALQNTFHDAQMVTVRLNLPGKIRISAIVGGDVYTPGTTLNYYETNRPDANSSYFPVDTKTDIIVKVEGYGSTPTVTTAEEPGTIAALGNMYEYEKWEPDGGEGATLYVKQIGSETTQITEDYADTIVEYEGYWTLDGQEFHFTGKDLEVLTLTDLAGNPIDRRIAFFYLEEDGMIYVDVPDDADWQTYAFRGLPDYVYKKMSAPASDKPESNQTPAISNETDTEQGVHETNSGTTWQLTDTVSMHFENGVFTVSGEGDMPEYSGRNEVAPWTYDVFRGDPTTVIIEEGITSISPMAFTGYLNITDVSLPSTLRVIGERAFSSCNSLQEIVIPDGVEEIGDKAFFNSYSLKKIYIPASVTKIGDGIFMSGNSNLVIYGEKGSAAEKYAEKWQITFEEDSTR